MIGRHHARAAAVLAAGRLRRRRGPGRRQIRRRCGPRRDLRVRRRAPPARPPGVRDRRGAHRGASRGGLRVGACGRAHPRREAARGDLGGGVGDHRRRARGRASTPPSGTSSASTPPSSRCASAATRSARRSSSPRSASGPFPDRVRDVGVVKDLATHDLDLVRWLGGAPVRTLAAQTAHRMGREHEDLVLVTGRLASDVPFNCIVDWLTPTKRRQSRDPRRAGDARRRHAHGRPDAVPQRQRDLRVVQRAGPARGERGGRDALRALAPRAAAGRARGVLRSPGAATRTRWSSRSRRGWRPSAAPRPCSTAPARRARRDRVLGEPLRRITAVVVALGKGRPAPRGAARVRRARGHRLRHRSPRRRPGEPRAGAVPRRGGPGGGAGRGRAGRAPARDAGHDGGRGRGPGSRRGGAAAATSTPTRSPTGPPSTRSSPPSAPACERARPSRSRRPSPSGRRARASRRRSRPPRACVRRRTSGSSSAPSACSAGGCCATSRPTRSSSAGSASAARRAASTSTARSSTPTSGRWARPRRPSWRSSPRRPTAT